MQNMPRVTSGRWGKLIRDSFQAAPGHQYLEFDYSQVELRVLAYLSGDKDLQAIYEKGLDLHDEVAAALFGPDFNKEQRIRAKFVNFGIAYGRGAESLASEFKIPKAEGAEMVRGWFHRFPVAHQYLLAQRQAVIDGRTLVTPLGRRRRFGLVTRETLNTLQNEAANFAIQSTASDLTLISAMRLAPVLQDRFSARVVNLIHDSILVEAPEGVPPSSVGVVVQEVMRGTPRHLLRTELPFETSMSWGTAWGSLEEH
jgi:DNA polymerase-1